MKSIVKKILKMLGIFIFLTVIIYLVLTISAFYNWCLENQIFVNSDNLLLELKSEKIQELGDNINNLAQVIENSGKELNEGSNHTLSEYYDPLGYSVWCYIQEGINQVLNKYFTISVLLGVSITIAYAVIISKNMKNILKFVIGYLGVMIIIPIIYTYSWTYRFIGIKDTYQSMPKYFYIIYTTIFILMYLINYKIGVKMTKELNQTMKNN